ncbi:MAG: hypothetical protein ACPL5I_06830 [Thermodesulfobacteriota bacterium]
MSQLHKRFNSDEVKELIEKYFRHKIGKGVKSTLDSFKDLIILYCDP